MGNRRFSVIAYDSVKRYPVGRHGQAKHQMPLITDVIRYHSGILVAVCSLLDIEYQGSSDIDTDLFLKDLASAGRSIMKKHRLAMGTFIPLI